MMYLYKNTKENLLNKIKKRFSNWKWWAMLTVYLPLAAIFVLIGMPLFLIGVLAVAAAEWYGMWIIDVLHRLHVFAHGWARGIEYKGVLVEFNIEEKNSD